MIALFAILNVCFSIAEYPQESALNILAFIWTRKLIRGFIEIHAALAIEKRLLLVYL